MYSDIFWTASEIEEMGPVMMRSRSVESGRTFALRTRLALVWLEIC